MKSESSVDIVEFLIDGVGEKSSSQVLVLCSVL